VNDCMDRPASIWKFGARCLPLRGIAILACIVATVASWKVCGDTTNAVFLKNCASCHGKDGKAQTSVARKLGVKDLSQSKLNDAQIEQQIREGRQGDQTAGKMPAFKDRLTAEEIKTFVTVVKEFRK
jgi:mono/diheme cytochrome c family protein